MAPLYPCTRIRAANSARHVVGFFDCHLDLVDAACDFFEDGLRAGCACLCVVTADHRSLILAELHLRGIDVARALADAQLVALDANAVVEQIVENGSVRPEEFRRAIAATVVACERRFPYVLGFGEAVRLLVEQGRIDAALQLERLWNDVLRDHALQLYCAYSRAARLMLEGAHLEAICDEHECIVTN